MGRMTYVQRRANRYEFRCRLPDDLAGKPAPQPLPPAIEELVNARTGLFKRELVRSLGTNDPEQAKRRAPLEIAKAHTRIDEARRLLREGPRSAIRPDQIEAVFRKHELRLLQLDEGMREFGFGMGPEPWVEGAGMTAEDHTWYEKFVDKRDTFMRMQAARMRPAAEIVELVEHHVREAGFELRPDDPAWRELRLAFIAMERRVWDTVKARLNGEIIPTPNAARVAESVTVSQAVVRWERGTGKGGKAPSPSAISEAKKGAKQFVELHGDLSISGVTRSHARELRDALVAVPKSLPRKYQRTSLGDLVRLRLQGEPRSAQTVNKTLTLLKAVFSRAARDGFFDASPGWINPFAVALDIDPSEKEPYEPFTTEELRQLFASPVYASGERPHGGRGEAAFWLPLIALYSGGRRNEIAQLKARDVRQSPEGIWYFDFSASNPDQRVKNVGSARVTPVHPELIRLGLTSFAAARLLSSPSGPLWAGFEPPVEPKAKAWSKWFGRYLGSHVTENPSKTFHSFRHTFKRTCRQAAIPQEVHDAFTGHASSSVGQRYGRERGVDGTLDRGIPLARLATELEKLTYPGLGLARNSIHES